MKTYYAAVLTPCLLRRNHQYMNSTVRNLLAACLMLGSAGLLTTGAWAADADAGKTLYATKCKGCHGADGTPPASMAKAMGVKPLSDPAIQAKSAADLATSITKGFGKMKAQAVSASDADNLAAFVKTMK